METEDLKRHKKAIAEWISRGLEKEGKVQSELADLLGITQPQIPRLKDGSRSLKAQEIPVVEAYLDEPFPYVHPDSDADNVTLVPGMAGGNLMPVRFRVQAGAWVEMESAVDAVLAEIPFSRDPSYPVTRSQYAVQVVGDSMNLRLPDGSFAIVVDAAGELPTHNTLVIVKRTKGGLVERTIKRFFKTEKGAELRPESTDPKFAAIPITGDDDTTIEIEGFVIGKYERL